MQDGGSGGCFDCMKFPQITETNAEMSAAISALINVPIFVWMLAYTIHKYGDEWWWFAVLITELAVMIALFFTVFCVAFSFLERYNK